MARKNVKLRECPKCHKMLTHSKFNHDKAVQDGLAEYCIACNRKLRADIKEQKRREQIKSELNEYNSLKFVLPPPAPKIRVKGEPLLRYPPGETPLDYGVRAMPL